jgi:hypothetical protein
MKKCPKCPLPKPLSEFNKKGKGYSAYCKTHNAEYLREHYRNNSQYYKDKKNNRKTDIKRWLKHYKKNLFCEECSESQNSLFRLSS